MLANETKMVIAALADQMKIHGVPKGDFMPRFVDWLGKPSPHPERNTRQRVELDRICKIDSIERPEECKQHLAALLGLV